jgi:hypothetical protein
MRGWTFQRSPTNSASCVFCQMVEGPNTPPFGTGSADLSTSAGGFPPSAGRTAAMSLPEYKGTRFDAITQLQYSNYRWAAVEAPNNPTKLELVVDFDLDDAVTTDQGRLIYDPSLNGGFVVADSQWQTWNARAGKWWGTQSSVTRGGVSVANPCVVTSPCTWAELLASFPNLGVHNVNGAIVLEAAPATSFGTRTSVDGVVVGVGSYVTTFDFELTPHPPVSATPPPPISQALYDSLIQPANLIATGRTGKVMRDIIVVQFKPSANLVDRQSAIALVNGVVIGGTGDGYPETGYLVRIPYVLSAGDSLLGPVLRATKTLRALPTIDFATIEVLDPITPQFLKPIDGPGFTRWPLSRDSANGSNWAQTALNAPFAWGCVTGTPSGQPAIPIAIVDEGFHDIADLRGNVAPSPEYTADTAQHGTAMAAIIGVSSE